MTDQPPPDCNDAREAADMGERPDLGHTADTLAAALDGSDLGSDTRAGSLRGGSASGSDDDPDQRTINQALEQQGEASADPQSPSGVDPDPINNTGADRQGPAGNPAEGKPGDVDAASG